MKHRPCNDSVFVHKSCRHYASHSVNDGTFDRPVAMTLAVSFFLVNHLLLQPENSFDI